MSDAVAGRPFIIRVGKKVRPLLNTLIAHNSLVPDTPVLDTSLFPWISNMEQWAFRIIEEFRILMTQGVSSFPALRDISPDHTRIAPDTRWKSFFLYGYGNCVLENCRRMPCTARFAAAIPGLNSAFVSFLEPGARIPLHNGVTKGLLTCHLGLQVPQDYRDCWIRIDDQMLCWQDGKCILFDDTYPHEVQNNTSDHRAVLLIQFERPTYGVGRLVQGMFLKAVRRSAFVQEAKNNLAHWHALHHEMARTERQTSGLTV
ncbi:aspartyl/asparaginyl beta-hydroxylase domain-containing protein [Novacetimonas hansenii]|uniref:Aspartyl/asparaginyl beta-hydroxylase domain-containing protein n=1 Tax=Novacetimonas hansenii TaxID=436 RepID=A0AAW5EQW4_NOVHA|nr:aspartyl/asparaginyl beta-hydroxylase domain-containing protein [Novacetimonas hansenii]MCJ8352864.1 aspartyl/asparaginyl beta-hydroxylase domain-containing protein [Novacetimonas hansenii]